MATREHTNQNCQTLDKLGNRFKSPRRGLIHGLTAVLSNSKLVARCRRAFTSIFPFLKMQSDITNVVYINWIVESEKVYHLVPKGFELWEENGLTVFTILTYRHGNFGPAFLGPLRRLFFSPIQSNWRLYLKSAQPQLPPGSTVLFLKNSMSSHLYALGTRVFSDALSTHLPQKFVHSYHDGVFETLISPGKGSAPIFNCVTPASNEKELNTAFSDMFESWQKAIKFLSFQDAAVSYTDRDSVLALCEIQLPIDIATIRPLKFQSEGFQCPMLEEFSPQSEPLCFVIPNVSFLATSEQLITL
jgi:hypothetical protein